MDKYTGVLERLCTVFNEEKIAAVLRKKEDETDLPMDILTVDLEDFSETGSNWMGEFSFLPLPNGAEGVCYVSSAITMADDIEDEASIRLMWLITRLNFYLPYGLFALSEDGKRLAYKLCSPVIDNDNEDELYEALSLIVSHSLDFMDDFGDMIVDVLEGSKDPDDVLDYFLGRQS